METPDGFPLWVFGFTLSIVLITTLDIAFASSLYMLSIQLRFYWLKSFVYKRMETRRMKDESSFQIALRIFVMFPAFIHKAYSMVRDYLRAKVEESRHLRPWATLDPTPLYRGEEPFLRSVYIDI